MHTKWNGFVRRELPPEPVLVPDGVHPARLVDQYLFSNAFGERVGFVYELTHGAHAGVTVVQSAAFSPAHSSKHASILRDLLGREPTPVELRDGIAHGLRDAPLKVLTKQECNRSGNRYSRVIAVTR
jgi:hypothetical protein